MEQQKVRNKRKWSSLEKSWILYDVGNSAFFMLTSTIIPIYFKNIAEAGGMSSSDSTAFWSYAVSISTLIGALLGPLLGTLADTKGYKKPLFTTFLLLGVAACAALAIPGSWILFLLLFILSRVGVQGSIIFYDSMLIDVTENEHMDSLSSHGYAWGYLGSCIPFIASILLILNAQNLSLSSGRATGIVFVLNAVWWLAITLPLIKGYQQKYYVEVEAYPVRKAFQRLGKLLREIRGQREIFLFLLAFFFYIDGVYTIISMATSYGKDVGISDNHLLLALLLTQVVAFPFALLFGILSRRFATSLLLRVCILGYIFIVLFALQLDRAWEFWALAVLVAMFQGGIQALSRSYFAKIIPKENSSEYFGLFDIFGKGASFLGTMMMGISTQISGSSRVGVAMIALLFIAGLFTFQKAVKK